MKLNIQLFADGEVIIPVDLDTKGFDRQIAKLEYELDELEETYKLALKDPDWDKKDLLDMEAEIQKTSNKIDALKKKQQEFNQTTQDVGNGFKNGLKSLTKMGLAIFGIRSAYNLIRQSANQLAESNDVMASKLQAIKGSLANAIAPIAEVLVNLVYKLLSYLNVITKTFLGVDLFAKSAKSIKNTNKGVQKLKKTITDFDEMRILNDNTQASGGSGGANLKAPQIDTTGFQKIVDNFRKMWNDILKIDREEAKKMFLNSGDWWGGLKFFVFDYTQGSIKELQGLFDFFKGLWDIIIGFVNNDTEKIRKGQENLIKGLKGYWEGFKQTIKSVMEAPVNIGTGIANKLKTLFIDKVITPILNKIDAIKKKLQDNFKDGFWKGIANTLIDVMNRAISKINSKFEINISDKASKILNAIGIKAPAGKTQLIKIPSIPKLAKGGIINLPGRGIPLATGGERGSEGVIPLTDSQQMALLGEAIGRYITINANITNTMNGRIISRELQKVQNESNFASNL